MIGKWPFRSCTAAKYSYSGNLLQLQNPRAGVSTTVGKDAAQSLPKLFDGLLVYIENCLYLRLGQAERLQGVEVEDDAQHVVSQSEFLDCSIGGALVGRNHTVGVKAQGNVLIIRLIGAALEGEHHAVTVFGFAHTGGHAFILWVFVCSGDLSGKSDRHGGRVAA
ncbi:hypothetical protein B0I32_1185 [Nonomuraea fuscirosea]|uniref:Uncharacterized protein n=1 Tax=Nonomuraea fuscirosea TaxID=1291556 RepID=A0A2T0MP76_9ACTN|nr:hypothetical protein B0I32_1185 [Nonomuraea fuscirosea]